jgi:type I restriction enzyme S subunit
MSWERQLVELQEVADIRYGFTAKASWDGVGPKFLRITDIQDGEVHWDGVPSVQLEDKDFEKHRLISGDIVFARTGATTGKSYLISKPPKAVPASYLIRLRLQDSCLLPEYVSYFFQTESYWKTIKAGTSGSAQGGFNASKLAGLKIPRFPLSEQKRIVANLDEAFAGIDEAIANTEKNLANARELFDSFLIAAFEKLSGSRPKKQLGNIVELISGQHIDKRDYNLEHRGIGYLTGPADFGKRYPAVSKWTELPKRMANKGDILITVKGSGVGKLNMMIESELAISRQLMAIRAKHINSEFLYAFLSLKKRYFQDLSNGAAIPGISRDDVLKLSIPVPTEDEQSEVVASLVDVGNEVERLKKGYERKLSSLAELKQSLLRMAFTGELTGSSAEKKMEEAVS